MSIAASLNTLLLSCMFQSDMLAFKREVMSLRCLGALNKPLNVVLKSTATKIRRGDVCKARSCDQLGAMIVR